jgi:hypothetical protein
MGSQLRRSPRNLPALRVGENRGDHRSGSSDHPADALKFSDSEYLFTVVVTATLSWQSCPDPAPGDMHVADSIETVIVSRARDLGGFEVRRALPSRMRQIVGPFIFIGPECCFLFQALETLWLFNGRRRRGSPIGHSRALRSQPPRSAAAHKCSQEMP